MVKLFPGDSQVSDYLVKIAGGQVTVALPGDGGPSPVCGVEPNLVGTAALALEYAAQSFQLLPQFIVGYAVTVRLPLLRTYANQR